MNAATAFENRREEFLAGIEQAQTHDARIDAAVFALEQIACVLAQDEQDEQRRQRQQAVLALARRAPVFLRAAGARGELVMEQRTDRSAQGKGTKKIARIAGAAALVLLAVVQLLDGNTLYAAVQLLGGAALVYGCKEKEPLTGVQARGVAELDAQALLDAIGEICRAADVCVSDLKLLEAETGAARLNGDADEATLDLLVSMMEAKAIGRPEAAARALDQAQQHLRLLGVDAVYYSEENAAYFDVLPTMGEARTVRPALLKEGRLIRRGVAARPMERSVGA